MEATGRRHFLGGLAGGTLAAGLGGPAGALGEPAAASTGPSVTDRVARAVLSMQRPTTRATAVFAPPRTGCWTT